MQTPISSLSLHPRSERNDDSVAQPVEHNTFNVGVLGSSPRRITKHKINPLIISRYQGIFF